MSHWTSIRNERRSLVAPRERSTSVRSPRPFETTSASGPEFLLADILNRIELPAEQDVPDLEMVKAEGITRWTVPHTEITIHQVTEGPRAGEFLFSPQTIERLDEFWERASELSPRAGTIPEGAVEGFLGSSGWMIPSAWVRALPAWSTQHGRRASRLAVARHGDLPGHGIVSHLRVDSLVASSAFGVDRGFGASRG